MCSVCGLQVVLVLSLTRPVLAQDLESGPALGKTLPALRVFDATGENQGKTIDAAAVRKGRPTVYALVQAERWSRPMARFLRELDKAVQREGEDCAVVAVWLTDDIEKTKEYLPKAQQSLQLQATTFACYVGEKQGPGEWNINADAHLTIVVASKGKVAASLGYRSVNETDAPKVHEALQKARKGK
jgi:hypothetical protein